MHYISYCRSKLSWLFLFHIYTCTATHLQICDALAEVSGERGTPQERASRLGFSGLICAYLEAVNNAWDVGVHGSAGIKWLSARYPSIPRPSQSAPQVSFSRRSGGNFHALLGKHFPGHIFNYSESHADSHPSGSLSHAHTRPTPTLNKLCLRRKWGARKDRDAGLSSYDASDKQQVCSECLPVFCQLSVSAKPAEGEKTIVSVKSVKNIRLEGGNERTVIQGSLKDFTTFSRT